MSHQYLLLLHENPASYADLSADEMREIVARYAQWAEEMAPISSSPKAWVG